jgi:hypothetical protein
MIDAAEAEFDAVECGLPDTGAILVRPDGFIDSVRSVAFSS